MPTTLQDLTTLTRIRYREPAVSEGLNRKLAVNTPPGVYRGFRLSIDPLLGDRTVEVSPDPFTNDNAAVYETLTHFSLTVRRDGPAFLLDLSAYSSQTVVIALYANYAPGVTTVAEFRAYEYFPTDEYTPAPERDELVVLGQVVVPAAGAIPAANITPLRRKVASFARAPGAVPWYPLVSNPYFIRGLTGWEYIVKSDADGEWGLGTGGATGTNTLRLRDISGGGIVGWNATLRYSLNVSLISNRAQTLRVRFMKKCISVPAAGTVTFELEFTDASGVNVHTQSVSVDVSAPDASFVEVVEFFDLTGVALGEQLQEVRFVAASMTTSAGANIVDIDEVQVHAEPLYAGDSEDLVGAREHSPTFSSLVLADPDTGSPSVLRPDQGAIWQLVRLMAGGSPTPLQPPSSSFPAVDLALYGSLIELGRGKVVQGSTGQDSPRIATPYVSTTDGYTLLLETASYDGSWSPTAQPQTRLYVHNTGYLVIAQNCYATASGAVVTWTRDDNTSDARKTEIRSDGIEGFVHLVAEPASWQDNTAAGNWTFANNGVAITGRLRVSSSLFGGAGAQFTGGVVSGGLDSSALANLQTQTLLGANLLNTAAEANIARVLASAQHAGVADRVLLWDTLFDSGGRRLRLYADTDTGATGIPDALTITLNAYWDNTTMLWSQDDGVAASFRLSLKRDFVDIERQLSGSLPWVEGAWLRVWRLDMAFAEIKERDIVHQWWNTTSNSNPAPLAPTVPNSLYAKNIVKAWGFITTGGGPPILQDGFGVASVAYAGPNVQVQFAPPGMDSSNYAVVLTSDGTGGTVLQVVTRTPLAVEIGAFNPYAATAILGRIDLSVATQYLNFVILGQQTT